MPVLAHKCLDGHLPSIVITLLIGLYSNIYLQLSYCKQGLIIFFFISKGVFPKIWGHPTHTAQALLTQHFFPSDEPNPRAKQIKSIHSFNCFIKPASPWIIYVAPNYTSPLSPIFYALFSFWNAQPSFTQTTDNLNSKIENKIKKQEQNFSDCRNESNYLNIFGNFAGLH